MTSRLALSVRRSGAAAEFTALVFACEDPGDRIVYSSSCGGGGTYLVVTLSALRTSDTQTQLAQRLPDYRTASAERRARGVRTEEYTQPESGTADGVADKGHSWAAWFIDPSANVLAVVPPNC